MGSEMCIRDRGSSAPARRHCPADSETTGGSPFRRTGMEVGSPSSPVLHSPTMTSTPAARSHTGPTVCAPSPEVSRHRPTACAPDGFRGSYSTGVSSYSAGVSPTSEEDGQQVEPAEAAAAAAAPTVRFQPPKQNRNQVQLPKFNGTGNLRSYLNQLDNAAGLGTGPQNTRPANVMLS